MKNLNQMADTFFNFASLNTEEPILPPDEDDCLDEEEYDALNEETFGDLEDNLSGDDWEQQHEQFAEYAKTSVDNDKTEHLLKDLSLSDLPDPPLSLSENSVWSYTPPNKNGDIPSVISTLQKASESFVRSRLDYPSRDGFGRGFNEINANASQSLVREPRQVKPRICTVEEIEKNLLKHSKTNAAPAHPPPYHQQSQQPYSKPLPPVNQQGPHHGPPPVPPPHFMPQPGMFPGRPPFQGPPFSRYVHGMPMMNMPPPMGPMPPPGFRMLPPHPFLQNMPPQRPPPSMPYQYPVNMQHLPPHMQRPAMQCMPPHNNRAIPPMPQQHGQYVQRQRTYSGRRDSNNQSESNSTHDEYAGLMTSREKQWLLNIQMLQLNTGTPYFDDYYYTVFKERKSKSRKDRYEGNRYSSNRQRRNSDRQENPLTPKVYTPLQFENSLGKLQCGSVTAPRKIIDMDVVNCDKDVENPGGSARDTRKTKQLLLELEMLYGLFLKAEDLTNPMAISNVKILRDIKQKQRLRELEAAQTPEQKQEVLELVMKESEPVVENPNDYIQKILTTLLQDDKFTSFMNVRKGKMLLLRLLPTLSNELFFPQIVEIWTKILLSIPIIGRRDTAGDNLLPKFYPLFKKYTQSVKMSDILDNTLSLTETIKLDNSRSTPLGSQGKAPIYFVLSNKFGISTITAMLVRTEFLISTNSASQSQQESWFSFIQTIGDLLCQISRVPAPLECISQGTFTKLCHRVPNLTTEKLQILNQHFVEAEECVGGR